MKRRVNKLHEVGMMDKEEAPKSFRTFFSYKYFRKHIFIQVIYNESET